MASAGQGPADELVCSGYQAQRRTDLGRYRAPGCTRRAGAVPTLPPLPVLAGRAGRAGCAARAAPQAGGAARQVQQLVAAWEKQGRPMNTLAVDMVLSFMTAEYGCMR
jgi:hypothetical protein